MPACVHDNNYVAQCITLLCSREGGGQGTRYDNMKCCACKPVYYSWCFAWYMNVQNHHIRYCQNYECVYLFQTIISWTILRVVTIAMSALVVSLFSVLLLVTSPLTSAGPTGTKCPTAPGRPETCVCQAKDGIIDMTPLSNTNGTARSSKNQLQLANIYNNNVAELPTLI